MTHIFRGVGSLALILSMVGCASMPPVPQLDLTNERVPAMAAEFRTRVMDKADAHDVHWRVWRDSDRVVTENLSAKTGERWQRDGETLFLQKLFHDDRKSVEYQMDDLQMSGVRSASLLRQSLLVDPALLAQLALKQSGWKDGYPYRRFAGKVGNQTWDVTMRVDLMIPTLMDVRTPLVHERTELVSSYPQAAAPWLPTSTESYEIIEFADFGDRESDPFVAKVQGELGTPHRH